MEVGCALARGLCLELDVFVSRKLRYPGNPEFGMGTITETGFTWINTQVVKNAEYRQPPFQDYLKQGMVIQQQENARQQRQYRQGKPLPFLSGRTVILVDDGVATGATFLASLHSLRPLHPQRLAAAIPIAPQEAIETISSLVDECEILDTPHSFTSVGAAYQHFNQLNDAQVLEWLDHNRAARNVPHQYAGHEALS